MNKALVAAVLASCIFPARVHGSTSSEASALTWVSTEDLIARFQKVSEQSAGVPTLVAGGYFIGIDAPPRFRVDPNGAPPPAVSPVMRELVRRGASAVPALLSHLSDARPTHLLISAAGVGPRRFCNEYDPKDRDSGKPFPGTKWVGDFSSEDHPMHGNYQVCVGDLCFVTLGEIVNRSLVAVYHRPTDCLVVNSPVQTPVLAAAARADWAGLTPEALKDRLLKDAESRRNPPSLTGVLQRLLFYYPDDGQALAMRFLNRPIHNKEPERTFLDQHLLLADDEAEQDRLLADFQAKYGEHDYQLVARDLVSQADESPVQIQSDPVSRELERLYADAFKNDPTTREAARQDANARRIVRRHFAGMKKHPRLLELDVTCVEQREIVAAVAAFPSSGVDQAVRDLLKRTLALRPSDPEDEFHRCELAFLCAERLTTSAQGRKIAREYEQLDYYLPPEQPDANAIRAYHRRCESFLQNLVKGLPAEPQGSEQQTQS